MTNAPLCVARRRRPVLAALAVLLAAGCGGAGGASGSSDGQATPAATVQTFYERLADAEYAQACRLVLPETLAAVARRGGSCETALAANTDNGIRRYPRLKVDESKVVVDGDAATVPLGAVTADGPFPGQDDDDDEDLRLVRREGKWWLDLL